MSITASNVYVKRWRDNASLRTSWLAQDPSPLAEIRVVTSRPFAALFKDRSETSAHESASAKQTQSSSAARSLKPPFGQRFAPT